MYRQAARAASPELYAQHKDRRMEEYNKLHNQGHRLSCQIAVSIASRTPNPPLCITQQGILIGLKALQLRSPGPSKQPKDHQKVRITEQHRHIQVYLNSAMKSAWNLANLSTKPCITSSRGRMVVRKWNVPSSCGYETQTCHLYKHRHVIFYKHRCVA